MDVFDAMMVCQYYLGNITRFPVEQESIVVHGNNPDMK